MKKLIKLLLTISSINLLASDPSPSVFQAVFTKLSTGESSTPFTFNKIPKLYPLFPKVSKFEILRAIKSIDPDILKEDIVIKIKDSEEFIIGNKLYDLSRYEIPINFIYDKRNKWPRDELQKQARQACRIALDLTGKITSTIEFDAFPEKTKHDLYVELASVAGLDSDKIDIKINGKLVDNNDEPLSNGKVDELLKDSTTTVRINDKHTKRWETVTTPTAADYVDRSTLLKEKKSHIPSGAVAIQALRELQIQKELFREYIKQNERYNPKNFKNLKNKFQEVETDKNKVRAYLFSLNVLPEPIQHELLKQELKKYLTD